MNGRSKPLLPLQVIKRMPVSKRNIPYPEIETGIYKAFAKFEKLNKKFPKLADVIQFLDIKVFTPKKYRGIFYSYTSLLRSYLFMLVKGIKSQPELERYLKKHKRERKKLGLKRTPDDTMINHFIRKYCDDDIKKELNYAKKRIIEIAEECKIDLDFEPKTKIRKKKRLKKEEEGPSRSFILSKVCNKIKKKFLPFFPIDLAPNSVYKKEDYWNLLLEMAGRDDFVENASFTLREKIKEKRVFCPNCYRLLYPLSDWTVKEKYSI